MNQQEHLAVLSHPMCLARFSVLCRYFARERGILPAAYPQIMLAFLMAAATAPFAAAESLMLRGKITRERLEPPLFVLGHWRTGTTLVQYLLAKDTRFGSFDPVLTFSFRYARMLGWLFGPLVKNQLSATRPQDNMPFAMDLPLEEYMVFADLEAAGNYAANYFPASFAYYMDTAYWQELPAAEQKRMMDTYDRMLRKCALLNGHKRLMLKSPDNTCRLPALRRQYPGAQYVHLTRDPYTVVRSTLHLFKTTFSMWALQKPPEREELEDMIIANFARMERSFLEASRDLAPSRLCEIRFEELERDPLGVMEGVYRQMDLGDFASAKPGMEQYLHTQKSYRKNRFGDDPQLREKIAEKLGFYITHYGFTP